MFPLRFTIGFLFRRRPSGKQLARRVVIIGMDGLDPRRVGRMMEEGDLPNFARLKKQGCYAELETTCPSISPVAWSSFQTGTNPGKHNIFDFLNRDLKTYMPDLSSSRIESYGGGSLFRRRKTNISLLRKSRPFWQILGEHGIFGTVLRVPITFPPERFRGLSLSAMCTPDLRGTQGSFTLYTSSDEEEMNPTGGAQVKVTISDKRVRTSLAGPPVGESELEIPIVVDLEGSDGSATLRISGKRVRLTKGVYSEWVTVKFKSGMRTITGICRFLLQSTSPFFRLYVTPLNIDPERPAMPISHPAYYSIYLSKLNGPYATLGLAEDTWALNEGAIDDGAFLEQAMSIQREREEMFFEALKRTRKGLCCCVFDLPDRIQHMFYRYVDEKRRDEDKDLADSPYADTIRDAYRHMDDLLGRAMKEIDDETLLFAISDHGFRSFRRGVNLNAWLRKEGYLALESGSSGGEYFHGVDWKRTKAYSFGLSGIYLNIKGREAEGIVSDEERSGLAQEIIEKLTGLPDPKDGAVAIRRVYDGEKVYSGPYSNNGPDLVVGYEDGYRASWENAVARTDGEVFSDNTRPWSGDHCVDPELVPGVFFCNRAVDLVDGQPKMIDMAPTVLNVFGVDVPGYVDGRPLPMSSGESEKQ